VPVVEAPSEGTVAIPSIEVTVEFPPNFSTTVSISRTRCGIVGMDSLQEPMGALMKRQNGWELVTWWNLLRTTEVWCPVAEDTPVY
jgi:hypothetical protein